MILPLLFLQSPTDVQAANTATASAVTQTNFSPWRVDTTGLTGPDSPHPDTSFPLTMSGTQADTQFGRGVVSGFSEGAVDGTVSQGASNEFQSFLNRFTSTGSPTSRVNQLQTQIHLNQGAYTFDDKFGITSTTNGAGNLVGQANGKFILTYQDLSSGAPRTIVCTGTFTAQQAVNPATGAPAFNPDGSAQIIYTQTSGIGNGNNLSDINPITNAGSNCTIK